MVNLLYADGWAGQCVSNKWPNKHNYIIISNKPITGSRWTANYSCQKLLGWSFWDDDKTLKHGGWETGKPTKRTKKKGASPGGSSRECKSFFFWKSFGATQQSLGFFGHGRYFFTDFTGHLKISATHLPPLRGDMLSLLLGLEPLEPFPWRILSATPRTLRRGVEGPSKAEKTTQQLSLQH